MNPAPTPGFNPVNNFSGKGVYVEIEDSVGRTITTKTVLSKADQPDVNVVWIRENPTTGQKAAMICGVDIVKNKQLFARLYEADSWDEGTLKGHIKAWSFNVLTRKFVLLYDELDTPV